MLFRSAGTSNPAGTNFTINGSKGTGTGAGGSIIFQVAPAGTTGTSQNALAAALTIASDKSAYFATNLGVGIAPQQDAGYGGITLSGSSGGQNVFKSGSTTVGNIYADSSWLAIVTVATTPIKFYTNGNNPRWQIGSDGHFTASNDNTYDIGASGANRPRNIYTSKSVSCGGVTFANLPTGVAGMISYVTDGSAASYVPGDTVSAGGGTTKVMVVYTGAAWKALAASF